MELKKLLSLLKKDALLIRRNPTWTVFEVLIPVFLLLVPLLFIDENMLMSYKYQQEGHKALRAFSGSVKNVNLTAKSTKIVLDAAGCDQVQKVDLQIISKYNNNQTRPNRKRFGELVKKRAEKCKPVGRIFVTPEGVDMIIPVVEEDFTDLSQDKGDNPAFKSFYAPFVPMLYKAMDERFRRYSAGSQFISTNHTYQLKALFIHDDKSDNFSFFTLFSVLIGLCITLPVINTARNMVVEKATIQPYLHSIGLSRSLFYTEHFIFATLKSTVLILAAIVFYCVFYWRFNAFWMLLGVFCYILSAISFSMLIASLFTNPRRVVEATFLIWGLSVLVPWFVFKLTGIWTIPASLNCNQALKSFIMAIEPHFVKDDGMTFVDGFTSGRDDIFPCFVYVIILLFDALVMSFGSVYVSKVADKTFNTVTNVFWKKVKGHTEEEKSSGSSETDLDNILLGEEHVEERKHAVSDIQLENLVKVYPNGETAVNGLSMRAIRGEVSVLLGHNGCGKSTTFGMITGIFEPTSGQILIEGTDAVNDRHSVRQSIGYCPQYNPLYDKLTVMEHLRLVNTLKDGSLEEFESEVDLLLVKINLHDQKNTQTRNLSGGMKRKLCVLMALVSGSRVVLLDEPTAGMDPGARLDVQKMLGEVKKERTVLLTTHYMDEAEKLGDWVFVMSHGKMAASGSLHYLKKKYGDGYLLTLVVSSDTQNDSEIGDTVEQICKVHVDNCRIKEHRGQMIEISLAESEKVKFLPLFKGIEAIIDKKYDHLPDYLLERALNLNILAMGVSVSSLEQVFIRIEKECDRVVFGIDDEQKKAKVEENFGKLVEAKKEPSLTGGSLTFLQYRTILYKRFIHVLRNPDQLILQFIVPLITLYYLMSKFEVFESYELPVIASNFDLSIYPDCKVFLQFEGAVDPRIEDYLSKFKNLEIHHTSIRNSVTRLVKNGTVVSKKIGLVISIFKNQTIVHYHDRTHNHLPIALNLLTNLKYLQIGNTHPVGNSELFMQLVPVEGGLSTAALSIFSSARFLAIGAILSSLISPAILFLVEEKVVKFQHQQLLTGISPFVFWSASILWDLIMFSLMMIYIIVLFLVFRIFSDYYYLLIVTFILYFFAYTSIVYLLSLFIKSPTVGSTLFIFHRLVAFAVGGLLFAILIALGSDMNEKNANVRKMYAFGLVDAGYIQMYALSKVFMSQTISFNLYTSSRKFLFGFDYIFEFMAIWIDFAYLLAIPIILFGAFITIRSNWFRRKMVYRNSVPMRHKKLSINSSSSKNETTNLLSSAKSTGKSSAKSTAMSTAKTENSVGGKAVVVVKDLVKNFGKHRAVNGLSLTVGKKECFGLLGQNGAGKTTTFDMLTGLTVPSGGSASVAGVDIMDGINIGYCPQFDAIMSQYSGRQCLKIMTRLHGYQNYEEVVELVLTCVGMAEHGDKLMKNCSGGQKRKISVGIALVSRSKCVMLDEPTAGIDPRARREIWDILHCIREKANTSIVLTSHSMEECEALCTRVGVVRNGEMVAMGSSQELKSRYGNFYLMTLVLPTLEIQEEVKRVVLEKWPDAILKTEPTKTSLNMVYQLPKNSDSKWSDTFLEVETIASRLQIVDFMLTQATLEDAFLRLNS